MANPATGTTEPWSKSVKGPIFLFGMERKVWEPFGTKIGTICFVEDFLLLKNMRAFGEGK